MSFLDSLWRSLLLLECKDGNWGSKSVISSDFLDTRGFPEANSARMKNICLPTGRCRFGKFISIQSTFFNNFHTQARCFFLNGKFHVSNHADRSVKRKLSVRDTIRGDQPVLWPGDANRGESLLAGVLQHASDKRLRGGFDDSS